MHAIEKTALIESEIFFDAEEIIALKMVKEMFTTFREVMETIREHSNYDTAFLETKQQIDDKKKYRCFDEDEISDLIDTLETFCQNTSITISAEG